MYRWYNLCHTIYSMFIFIETSKHCSKCTWCYMYMMFIKKATLWWTFLVLSLTSGQVCQTKMYNILYSWLHKHASVSLEELFSRTKIQTFWSVIAHVHINLGIRYMCARICTCMYTCIYGTKFQQHVHVCAQRLMQL